MIKEQKSKYDCTISFGTEIESYNLRNVLQEYCTNYGIYESRFTCHTGIVVDEYGITKEGWPFLLYVEVESQLGMIISFRKYITELITNPEFGVLSIFEQSKSGDETIDFILKQNENE